MLQFGQFIFSARDIIVWGSKKVLGRHGPLISAILLLALMCYLLWPFAQSMYLLTTAY